MSDGLPLGEQVFESLPAKFPFDERKDGLNEVLHPWQHFDWKQSPSDAIKEVQSPLAPPPTPPSPQLTHSRRWSKQAANDL